MIFRTLREKLKSRPDPFAIQRKLLDEDVFPTIFDCGANVGQSAKRYRKAFPNARIYSFEPDPKCLQKIKKRTVKDSEIIPVPLALADTPGTREFHINKVTATNSFYPPVEKWRLWAPEGALELKESIEVEVSTIDHFCHNRAIRHISILKLDTQGAECAILQGAKEMLTEKKVGMIYCEVVFIPIYQNQVLAHEIIKELNRLDYQLYDLFDPVYAANGQLLRADTLFLLQK